MLDRILMKQIPWAGAWIFGLLLGTPALAASTSQGEVLGTEGTVDFERGLTNWTSAIVGQQLVPADRLRTLSLSRASLQLVELGRLRVNELTTLEILPPKVRTSKPTLDIKSGSLYFFTRDKPREFLIQAPHAIAASRGTEFLVTIESSGRNVFTVFDGEVELSNPQGILVLTNGEQGTVLAGQAPVKTPVLQSTNIVQWWLYYPGVLDTDEVPLSVAERTALAVSIGNYRTGDLISALQTYPAGRVPQTDGERLYYAGLLLAAGQVDKTETNLTLVSSQPALANALREVIAAVTLRPFTESGNPVLTTEWLARSYLQQSRFDLPGALASAEAAANKSPNLGFAWERVAELEFSFGHTAKALAALEQCLKLSPRNAQAWALKGFLAAANNQTKAAVESFNQAIALDTALGNGWLGRGLVRIRMGQSAAGRADLQTAAAMEPNRSVLRSYLGKGFDNLGDTTNAVREIALAKRLDPSDPTPWLYSALLLRQQLHFNEAIDDLEKSAELTPNRRAYRSRLLLDEDRAVSSSSLATIYQNAGMNEVSVREAARAVASDYGNPSAHLFLAESFNALRDPTRFNLRIETAWFNELLLANILAPVGGGNLSQNISQQEYSRLFEGNRLGFSTFSEYRSDKQFRELASQFGTVGNTAYALDLDYQHNDGVRPNNELNRIEWYTTIKQQITPHDSVLVLLKYQDYHSGDNFQYYNPTAPGVVRTNFTFDEFQNPLAVAAYHRQWTPGIHTMLLGGRLENDQRFSDTGVSTLVLTTNGDHSVRFVENSPGFDAYYRSQFTIYTCELSQIFQGERYSLVLGGRFQTGTFDTTNRLAFPASQTNLLQDFESPPATDHSRDPFERRSAYAYNTFEPLDHLLLTAGLAYDQLTFPENFRSPPISHGSITRDQFSPKAALVWSPLPELSLRGVFARALGGVSFDESFRLEPTQLAGFNQSFRTIIPESLPRVGSVSAPTYQVGGAALDLKFKTRTYFGVQVELLSSEVDRTIGVFDNNGVPFPPPPPPPISTPSKTSEHLDYDERSVTAALNQLVSDAWSFGAQYRFTQSKLHTVDPDILNPALFPPLRADFDHTERAEFHQATLFALFNDSSGFFARAESQWYHQDNFGYSPVLASSDFWQHNVFIGYRLKRQLGEVTFGILNLADTDYHLNPLNLYAELPRERVFLARLKINL